jgi:Kef-type K+ transport system membrane component KefB
VETADAVSLVVFYLGAFFSPLLAGRLRLPAAVVEILYGVLVGTSALGLVRPAPFTTFLSNLGLVFLMFLVGTEIDFNRIEKEGGRNLLLSGGVAAAVFVVAGLLARQIGWPPFLALILGAMSVGILLVALKEAGASQSRFGQMLLLVGSIGEFLTLMALTAFDLVHQFGVGVPLVEEALKTLLLFAAAYAMLSTLRLLVWWFPHHFKRWVEGHDPSELGVRAGFFLMLSLAALAAAVGLESILGAFLAGALFSFVFRHRGELESKLQGLGQGFFIPLFFINVGVAFDVQVLGEPGAVIRLVLLLAGASLLAKLVPAALLILAGFRVREVMAGGFLLAAPLTLLVAAASIGSRMGVLQADLAAAIVLLAIISGVAFPTCFKAVLGTPSTR